MTGSIAVTESFLIGKLKENPYFFEQLHQLAKKVEHSRRVASIGREIAQKEGMDADAMAVACLLHDVAYCVPGVPMENHTRHGRLSAVIARPFITSLDMPAEIIEDILYGIAIHVDGEADFEGEKTVFARTISDAIIIERYGALGIFEELNDLQFFKLERDEKLYHVSRLLREAEEANLPEPATLTARELRLFQLSFYAEYFRRMKTQLFNSAAPFEP